MTRQQVNKMARSTGHGGYGGTGSMGLEGVGGFKMPPLSEEEDRMLHAVSGSVWVRDSVNRGGECAWWVGPRYFKSWRRGVGGWNQEGANRGEWEELVGGAMKMEPRDRVEL